MFTSNMRGGHKSHSPLPPEAPQLRCISKCNTVDNINYWRQQQDFLITTNKSRLLHEGSGGSGVQRLRLIIYSSRLIIGTLHTWLSWQEYYLLQTQKHAHSIGLCSECIATCLISCIWKELLRNFKHVCMKYIHKAAAITIPMRTVVHVITPLYQLCGIYKAVAYICTVSFRKTGWKLCLSWKQWTCWTSNCIFTCRPEVGCIMFIELLVIGPTGAS